MVDTGQEAANLIDRLNWICVIIYTKGMESIKPKNTSDRDYEKELKAWTKANQFPKSVEFFVDDLSNKFGLGGSGNPPSTTVTGDDIKKLQSEINSDDFKAQMNILKPKITDPNLLKAWKDAFKFPDVLQNFLTDAKNFLDGLGGPMQFTTFQKILKGYVNDVSIELGLAPLP